MLRFPFFYRAIAMTAVISSSAACASNCDTLTFTKVCSAGPCYGTDGDDIIKATLMTSAVYGQKGNDTICLSGGSRADVFGGAGNDTIIGGPGSDRLFGEAGNDTIIAGDGADRAFGGAGNDTILGGAGDDRIYGGPGNDTLKGEGGDDRICGEAGTDTLIGGGQGRDTCSKSETVLSCAHQADNSSKYSCPAENPKAAKSARAG